MWDIDDDKTFDFRPKIQAVEGLACLSLIFYDNI